MAGQRVLSLHQQPLDLEETGMDWNLAHIGGHYFTGEYASEVLAQMAAFVECLESTGDTEVVGVQLNWNEEEYGGIVHYETPDFVGLPVQAQVAEILDSASDDLSDDLSVNQRIEELTHDLAAALSELGAAEERAQAIADELEEYPLWYDSEWAESVDL